MRRKSNTTKPKKKKRISNFRRGVNFEHRTRTHFKEKEGYSYVERNPKSLGASDMWGFKAVIVTKEMLGQTLTRLTLGCYGFTIERMHELALSTAAKVFKIHGSNTELIPGRSVFYSCEPVEITPHEIGQVLTKTILPQCKSNKYYFQDEDRERLLILSKETGGEPLLVHKNKNRGPLIIEKVVPLPRETEERIC